MPIIHLARHGQAAAGWGDEPDPGLDDLGREQARSVAERLAAMGSLDVVSSPLRRCRETAREYAEPRGLTVAVVDSVAEIPTPAGLGVADRGPWLHQAMAGRWSDLGPRFTGFRDGVVGYLGDLRADTVVFSHFVAINAVIGHCLDDDRLVVRRLDNCSVTTVVADDRGLRLVEAGDEADTQVN